MQETRQKKREPSGFTPLEKDPDGVGGEYQEENCGSKPPSSITASPGIYLSPKRPKVLRGLLSNGVKGRSSLTGFTLVEITVAVAIAAMLGTAAAVVSLQVKKTWQQQKENIELIQNGRWAMYRIITELRSSSNITVPLSDRLRCELSPGGAANRVWYWRGDGGAQGAIDTLYRGRGNGFGTANANRQELARFVVDNPGGAGSYPIFSKTSGLVTVWVTVSAGSGTYTFRDQVRARN